MINKKIDEISAKLETIKVLVQDNEYLENVEKRCDEVNKKYTQALEVAQKRFDRIQKAIEYIQDNYLFDIEYHEEGDFNRVSCKQQKIELLKILRGVDIHSVEHFEDILKGGKDNE